MTIANDDLDTLIRECQFMLDELAAALFQLRDRFGYTPPADPIQRAVGLPPVARLRLRELVMGDVIRWAPSQDWQTVTELGTLVGSHVLIGTSAWNGCRYPFADGTIVDVKLDGRDRLLAQAERDLAGEPDGF